MRELLSLVAKSDAGSSAVMLKATNWEPFGLIALTTALLRAKARVSPPSRVSATPTPLLAGGKEASIILLKKNNTIIKGGMGTG